MLSTPITRRESLLLVATLFGSISARTALGARYARPDSRENAEVRSDLGARLDEAVKTGKLENLHSIIVARGDNVVLERYYEGPDQFWGMPIGSVAFGPTVKHDLRSASKSVVGLLYGIALHEGRVPQLDAVLIDQFPDLKDLALDVRKRTIKVRHALTMTMGMEWPEDKVSYADVRNAEIAMYLATDQFRYVFDHPMIAEPGTRWAYCGGATAILGHLIAQGSKAPLFKYAREHLFEPLDIVMFSGSAARTGRLQRRRDYGCAPEILQSLVSWYSIAVDGAISKSCRKIGSTMP
jgi:CubicO group peptidase (beta-lactamase class C family)